jgi:hypothetical protein
MKKINAWHQAIVTHLHAAGGPLRVEQIWQRMEAAGFTHSSKMPRSTLGARISELVKEQKLTRVAPRTYQLVQEMSEAASSMKAASMEAAP